MVLFRIRIVLESHGPGRAGSSQRIRVCQCSRLKYGVGESETALSGRCGVLETKLSKGLASSVVAGMFSWGECFTDTNANANANAKANAKAKANTNANAKANANARSDKFNLFKWYDGLQIAKKTCATALLPTHYRTKYSTSGNRRFG